MGNLVLVSMVAAKTERQNGDFPDLDGVKKRGCRRIVRKEKVRLIISCCKYVVLVLILASICL